VRRTQDVVARWTPYSSWCWVDVWRCRVRPRSAPARLPRGHQVYVGRHPRCVTMHRARWVTCNLAVQLAHGTPPRGPARSDPGVAAVDVGLSVWSVMQRRLVVARELLMTGRPLGAAGLGRVRHPRSGWRGREYRRHRGGARRPARSWEADGVCLLLTSTVCSVAQIPSPDARNLSSLASGTHCRGHRRPALRRPGPAVLFCAGRVGGVGGDQPFVELGQPVGDPPRAVLQRCGLGSPAEGRAHQRPCDQPADRGRRRRGVSRVHQQR